MATELNEGEKAQLRELAADAAGWVETCRTAFCSGWDAAMKHVGQQASEGIAHLDGDECCYFQD
jgi:hypothetical protein